MLILKELPTEAIASLCRKHGVRELAVFGSATRGDIGPDSDVDFLVQFSDNDGGPWMSKYQDLGDELAQLLGRKVDLISRRAVETNPNWLVRAEILNTARVLYGP